MKKVRRILCGALAALLLAGCGSGAAGEYAIVETSYPARTQKTEERVDTEELVRFSSETAAKIFAEGENTVYSPVSLYMALGMVTELTEGQTKRQVTNLLGVSDSEALRQWTQSLWRQLYRDEKDSALWLGNAAFLNETMSFHKEPLEVLAKDYYASSYCLPMGTSGADKTIAAWLNQQTNDLLTDDTGAIRTEKRDLLRLYNTIYYKAPWQAEFFGGATAEDIFTAADGTEQKTDFMHISIEGSPVARGEGYRRASLYLKDGGEMTFYLPDEGVTVEELLQRENLLGELLPVDEWVVQVNWSVPKFDLHDSLKLNDALQALGVTDAFDVSKADFAPLTEQPAYVESVNQAARVKIDEEGVEAAAYTEVDTNAAAAPPQEMPEEEMNLNRPFLFVIWKDGAPLFVGAVQTMEGM
jgi:serine protease inhibitor